MNETTIPKYWRSLDELEGSEEFQEFVHREFPVAASEYPAGVSRRRWMQLMGASFALASVAGCRWETEKIAPLVHRPEGYVPGKTQKYATTIELAGAPRHLLVTCFDNRPVKIEGNPDHPASMGGTDVFSQSATLTLYDPDRSGTCRLRKAEDRKKPNAKPQAQSWGDFDNYLAELLSDGEGEGLAVLMEPTSSLSTAAAAEKLVQAKPQARLYEYAPINNDNEIAGADLAFGQKLRPHYKLAEAKVIATFEADLLCSHPDSTRYSRDWAATREIDPESAGHATMGRLYAVESQFTGTGAAADHRAAIKSTDIGWALAQVRDQIAQRLNGQEPEAPEAIAERAKLRQQAEAKANGEGHDDEHADEHAEDDHKAPAVTADQVLWALADDLAAHKGESVVVVGPQQPAEVHALAHEINGLLENFGKTVEFTELPQNETPRGSIAELTAAMDSGDITSLVIIGGNPVFDAPADLAFADKLSVLDNTIRLGYYEDETSLACQWHLPMCHPLETWGDAVSYQGLPSVAQPLLNPIYETRSPLQLLTQLAGEDASEPQKLVREAFASVLAEPPSDAAWKKLLHDGFVDSSIYTTASPSLVEGLQLEFAERSEPGTTEIVFSPSASLYDGSFANNGWLQELPNFITKVTWDNVAIVSPWTADQLRVKQNELLNVEVNGQSVELPVYVLPGQANGSIGVQLGYGRTAAGAVGGVGEGLRILRFRRYWLGEDEVIVVGKNLYPLRTSDTMHVASEVSATPTGRSYDLATTQDHFAIDLAGLQLTAKRIHELVREAPLEEYNEDPTFAKHVVHEIETDPLFDDRTWRDRPNAWGMAVDLNKCTGCSGCVIACQAENNVPVVGKEQVLAGREMHWIRIDRYFHGMPDEFNNEDPASPAVASQMVTCQQCESAPCEQVCPVAATVHSDEGLNDMVYNRCVGTRYCANNCPYKVRRFNYFHMTGYMERPENELVQLANNPEVTVRSRGVMEKCTFCTQRISAARVESKVTNQPIADGDLQTACQQACATGAIVFGDLNDPESRVSKAHADPRAYGMLAELDVRPRNMYLAKISNPHPSLAPLPQPKHGHGAHGEGHDDHDDHDDHDHEGEGEGDHDHEDEAATAKRNDFAFPIIG